MTHQDDSIRAFIAISLPGGVQRFLAGLQSDLKNRGITGSWPRADSMHLTLRFLGNIPSDQIEGIRESMLKAAQNSSPCILGASGIGVFPSVKKPRVIWSGIKGETHSLERIHRELEAALFRSIGLKKENRRFAPHFTLARVKKPVHPREMIQIMQAYQKTSSPEFKAGDIKLFKSELGPSGAQHALLFSIALGD